MASLRLYICGNLRAGETHRRPRGLRAAESIGEALALWANRDGAEFGMAWPARVFEGWAGSAEIIAKERHAVRVKALRVERELPATDVFGARADDLATHVSKIDETRWLRPRSLASAEALTTELVAEHYAALADYGPVTARPVEFARTWHEARDRRAEANPHAPFIMNAVRASCAIETGTFDVAMQLVQQRVSRQAYVGTWDAAWAEAERSVATGIYQLGAFGRVPPTDAHFSLANSARALEALGRALSAAREPARRVGWQMARDLFTYAPGDVPSSVEAYAEASVVGRRAFAEAISDRPIHPSGCEICRNLSEWRRGLVNLCIITTGEAVWMAAVNAAFAAGWRAAHLVNPSTQGRIDPWRPLNDIWRAGGWPIGPTRTSYLVFLPQPRS